MSQLLHQKKKGPKIVEKGHSRLSALTITKVKGKSPENGVWGKVQGRGSGWSNKENANEANRKKKKRGPRPPSNRECCERGD